MKHRAIFLSDCLKNANPPFGKNEKKRFDRSSHTIPRLLAAFCWTSLLFFTPPAHAETPREWVQSNLDSLVTLYQHLHAHPELSQREEKTSERVAQELKAIGAEVTQRVGGFGVVGLLRNGEGPTIMLRTDLDALPVTEQTGLVFSSQVKVTDDMGAEVGVMHACGHDLHMTNLIGVARYLAAHKDRWKGTAMFLGQPAEERGAGARSMLDDGLFSRFPKPAGAIAIHVEPFLPTGSVGVRGGYSLANVDSVDITIRGKGGHGAYPHRTIDPIVQAAELIMSLQTLVSREIKPIDAAVVTVGSIHGGTKHNIIGDSCHLQLTVRSYSDEVRKQLLDGIRRKANAIATAYRAPEPTIKISEGTPALWNDEALAARLTPLFKELLGAEKVIMSEPSMGGEDFSEYGRAGVPILMFSLGVVDAKRLARFKELGQEPPSLHSPIFYPDVEDSLLTGIPAMATAAIELFRSPPVPPKTANK
jgi:amidohydrolase